MGAELTADRLMTKKWGMPPQVRGPAFFLNRALLRLNPALPVAHCFDSVFFLINK